MEARNKQVFVDSNFFIAFFNETDTLHQEALSIGAKLEKQKTELLISNFIFLEVVTVLSQRVNKAVALQVGRHLLSSPSIEIIHIDEVLHNHSWQIFQEVRNKNVSFVDCSIIATMKAEGVLELLTLDAEDFKKLQKKYRFRLRELPFLKR